MMKSVFLGLALSAAVMAPATAHAQSYQEARLLKTMDAADLEAVLTSLGATWELSQRENDTEAYQIKFANGLNAVFWYRVCDEGQCRGLMLVASFARPEGTASDAELDEKLRTFNDRTPAIKAYRTNSGGVIAQSYIISDNGITMGNMKSQIEVFVNSCGSLRETLY